MSELNTTSLTPIIYSYDTVSAELQTMFNNVGIMPISVDNSILKDKLQCAASRALIFITRGLIKQPTTDLLNFDFITPRDWVDNPNTVITKYLEENPNVPSARNTTMAAVHFEFNRIWGDSIPDFHIMWSTLLDMLSERNPAATPLCDTLSINWNYLHVGPKEELDETYANTPLITFIPPEGCQRLILNSMQCRQFAFNLYELAVPVLLFNIYAYHPMNTYVINQATELIMMFHKNNAVIKDIAIKMSSLNPDYTVYIGSSWNSSCIIIVKNNIDDIITKLNHYAVLRSNY